MLAGAGTGKTRVITHRVASLLEEGVPAWRILAVTFTNRAAREMRERIAALCPDEAQVREMWVGTFHSICVRILRRHGDVLGLTPRFTIYDTGDQSSVMARVLKDLNVSDRLYSPRGVLGHIDRAKNLGLGPDELDPLDLVEPVRSVVAKAYALYQERLRASDAVDFGDLLLHTVNLLRRAERPKEGQLADLDPMLHLARRFQHIVVDEFQDTNPVQAELVDRLATRAELCVVGDDDQSIYGWRGADVAQILRFADRHPGTQTIRLEQNYRSTMNILRCADAVIGKNRGRLGKTLWSELGDGDPVRVMMLGTERDEGRFIAQRVRSAIDEGAEAEDIAIFYRTHAQSRVIEDEVRRAGLFCRLVGGVAFYERQEIKDVLSYLTVLDNPRSDAHLLRILNRPARGIGATSQAKVVELAAARGCSVWEVLERVDEVGLGRSAARKIEAFVALLRELQEEATRTRLDDLVLRIVEATGYRERLALEDSEESAARLENLQELFGNVAEFVQEVPEGTIAEYLELVSLVGGEHREGDSGRAVTLMTIHSAKGLEFEHVYLTGMEERVFPHARVLDDPTQMEEERRLAYVALTRAKRHLVLTMTARRRLYGQLQVGQPSRFVLDLPAECIARIDTQRPTAPARPVPAARPRSEWQDDIVYDASVDVPDVVPDLADHDVAPPPEGDAVPLYVGMLVRHKLYGTAEVLGWSGSGERLKLQLRLPTREVKTIMARFVEPL